MPKSLFKASFSPEGVAGVWPRRLSSQRYQAGHRNLGCNARSVSFVFGDDDVASSELPDTETAAAFALGPPRRPGSRCQQVAHHTRNRSAAPARRAAGAPGQRDSIRAVRWVVSAPQFRNRRPQMSWDPARTFPPRLPSP
jgi:hypothetical protein